MSSESKIPESALAQPTPDAGSAPLPPSRFRAVFMKPSGGIRAGWRFAIFVALLLVFESIALLLLVHIPAFGKLRKAALAGTLTPMYLIVFEVEQFGTALLAAAIMCRIERGEFKAYGIPLRGAFGKNFWVGLLWGLTFISIELTAMKGLGGFSFGGLAISGAAIAKYAAVWAVGFVLVGFAEEFVFRGYAQFTLTQGVGFWPAAILLSAVFGGLHLLNGGEDWVGAAQVFVFAIFACFTLKRTGSLWFAIGFHAAGDYAESFLYSVPDSGTMATHHLLHSSVHGPAWLTGGAVGPEGSILAFALFALAFFLFAWIYPSNKAESRDKSQSGVKVAAL